MELLHSKIIGSGPPVIIVHGFLGMSDNWRTLGKKYAEKYQVHLVDLRNHGKSFHSYDFSYELMVKDLLYYVNFYRLDKLKIIGHSMGGKVAMLFAVTYPRLTEKLVVADISPKFYPPHHQQILDAIESIDFNIHNSRILVEGQLSKYIKSKGVVQFLLKNVYRKDKKTLDFRFNLKSLVDHYDDELGRALDQDAVFSGRTLFLKGEQSAYISENDHDLIQKHFPKSIINTVKNAGHWLHAENPSDFLEYTLTFFEN